MMQLKQSSLNVMSAILAVSLGAAPAVYADHASPWGEGWANMPNDIHNTRLDTLDSDDDTFTDFVRYGNGADSVNRFLDDDLTTGGVMGGGSALGGGGLGGGMGGGGRR